VKCGVCGIQSNIAAFGQLDEEADLDQDEVKALGCYVDPPCGLQILGTERHESRRIDRQLRGRSGRQGDPGSSRFFMSLEDDLMRLFATDRVARVMDKLGAEEGEVITHPWMTKAIEKAQRRVELQNFQARKRLLEYDDVMNQQREVAYDLRLFALEGGEDLKGEVWEMIETSVRSDFEQVIEAGSLSDDWDLDALREKTLLNYFLLPTFLDVSDLAPIDYPWANTEELETALIAFIHDAYHAKLESFGDAWERILSFITLSVIDSKWKDHLYDLDHLRDSIRYRAYGQRDPLIEYKKEAFEAFVDLMDDLRRTLANRLFRAQLEQPRAMRQQRVTRMSGPSDVPATGVSGAPAGGGATAPAARPEASPTGVAAPAVTADPAYAEVGRNDPCPCGSGKKYKKCHGATA
jgi:preprotein translocase subunit SecA